jgi:hypothetical protein
MLKKIRGLALKREIEAVEATAAHVTRNRQAQHLTDNVAS